MEKILGFVYYGFVYTVYETGEASGRFRIVRKSQKTQKEQEVTTDDDSIFDNADGNVMNELLTQCSDKVFLSAILEKHRASKKAIRNLFMQKEESDD